MANHSSAYIRIDIFYVILHILKFALCYNYDIMNIIGFYITWALLSFAYIYYIYYTVYSAWPLPMSMNYIHINMCTHFN